MNESDRSEQILSYIRQYKQKHGYPPTYREIARAVGINSTSNVAYHLQRLAKSGKLESDYRVARSIRLAPAEILDDAGLRREYADLCDRYAAATDELKALKRAAQPFVGFFSDTPESLDSTATLAIKTFTGRVITAGDVQRLQQLIEEE